MLYLGAKRALLGGKKVWNPGLLIGPSDIGTWQTSGLPMIYQDSNGATPVIAAGNPIGLRLDNRFGLARGADVINGGFNTDTAWTKTGAWEITGGVAQSIAVANGNLTQNHPETLAVGNWVEVSFTIVSRGGGVIYMLVAGNISNSGATPYFAPGTYRAMVPVLSVTNNTVGFALGSTPSGFVIDNVSFRKPPGGHATQATTTARPAYRATPVPHVDYDIDDVLVTTFPSSLGSNCTVARAVPGIGAVILTSQTIGTSYSDNVDNRELFIINRALTAGETSQLTSHLNARSF